ncbi:MAG: 16S rRNA (cytidine(1402)-2'-O)-methyltransferase [Parcubacteria group bacterium]|nr:16S rRNA (cytidine(1402)-2'-O)-methyltransferase [Parcubacteria group bacterium]|tara:strand:- start:67 stop:735 length:669 start_codon:yes stop_codon:yes gene_type:complete
MTGTLFVVATPIGNLEDITLRALRVLKEVDVIACEDTRVTQRLVKNYKIETQLVSYHQHSERGKIEFLIDKLKQGKDVALVSDAGTPGISDPGRLMVMAAAEEGIKVEAVAGPSAVAAALSVSGLPTDRFLFLGFLPHKKKRSTMLKEIVDAKQTVVFYESVHRILKLLEEFKDLELEREIVVIRELTKKFEASYRGLPTEVYRQLINDKVKGEFVVIVASK